MAAQIHQFMCLQDNFGVLIHDPATGATASIDAPEAGPILAALAEKGWTLTDILVTHHHDDHIGGIPALREKFPKVRVVGPAPDRERVPGADVYVGEGDKVKVGNLEAQVFETPGHTRGHITYFFPVDKMLFAGDTLFALGCGRAFEAPGAVLYQSVMKLAALPGDTKLYCGHEYTLSNGKFALAVDPDNTALQARMQDIIALRDKQQPTLPSLLSVELATNPFLRANDPAIRKQLDMAGAEPAAVFTELRERKNKF
ncbi:MULTISPECIES: hydroxyacylglutathione hydrolase [unclassified Beijerinckia]|uniref:hydroxyacylglutathione hydrolase n=1 Tax=unclassified Beijerinckia TaxID=2638183 RepID=UPI0008968E9D|nr:MULTISPECIES: hydroxyacylglutathione hydrolase [unclassified Beijerinckia]MDH7799700.1 hydroxyacylglutathione hydrolase [Beijerinckia sp. GAS462]SEB49682.1 hydroxyacylglutathione hydrolase [Beijerinckia sp. 28-YEA-48]